MTKEIKLTKEQVIVQDLVNQLQDKETIIINLRVQIAQLKLALTEAKEEAKESVESVESVEKKSAKDKVEEK